MHAEVIPVEYRSRGCESSPAPLDLLQNIARFSGY
jgi:hypothetical protein